MTTVTLEEAGARLTSLILDAVPGEIIVVTSHGKPIAEFRRLGEQEQPPPGINRFAECIRSLPEPVGTGPSDEELLANLRAERDSWD